MYILDLIEYSSLIQRYIMFSTIPDDLYSMYKVVRMQHDAMMHTQNESLHTVCLGSSHAYKGFFAKENEFNLGATSVDLYIADQLHRIVSIKKNELKNVILFYDVFSAGFELEKTLSWYKQIPYSMIYKMPWRDLAIRRRVQSIYMKRSLAKMPFETPLAGYRGNSTYDWFFPPEASAVDRVKGHLKNSFRHDSQIKYVKSIISRCEAYKQKLIIVLPPLREDYRIHLPSNIVLYDELICSCKENNVLLLDAVSDSRFYYDDFGDLDHLNLKGANKFSDIIRELL